MILHDCGSIEGKELSQSRFKGTGILVAPAGGLLGGYVTNQALLGQSFPAETSTDGSPPGDVLEDRESALRRGGSR